jgi:Endoglucanase
MFLRLHIKFIRAIRRAGRYGQCFLGLVALCWQLIACGKAHTANTGLPFLHQQGTAIIDENEQAVILRGVNFGAWLLWEGWEWGGPLGQSETNIKNQMRQIVGDAGTAEFTQQVHAEFIAENDIRRVVQMGFNVVRVPLNYRLLEDDTQPGVYLDSGWAVLDQLLAWCLHYKLYVVLDLHSAPGGQSIIFTSDPGPTLLWDSNDLQDRTINLWKSIAARYQNHSEVAGYDLLNEPIPPTPAALVSIYQRIAAAIREVDTRHLLFVEGANFAKDFSMFSEPPDANMAYTFHQYTTSASARAAEVEQWKTLAEAQNIPLWCGEFGQTDPDTVADAVALYSAAENHVSGQALWTWKDTLANGNQLFSIIGARPDWNQFMLWSWTGFNQPTADQVQNGINQFLSASAIDTCSENTSMAMALGARP